MHNYSKIVVLKLSEFEFIKSRISLCVFWKVKEKKVDFVLRKTRKIVCKHLCKQGRSKIQKKSEESFVQWKRIQYCLEIMTDWTKGWPGKYSKMVWQAGVVKLCSNTKLEMQSRTKYLKTLHCSRNKYYIVTGTGGVVL